MKTQISGALAALALCSAYADGSSNSASKTSTDAVNVGDHISVASKSCGYQRVKSSVSGATAPAASSATATTTQATSDMGLCAPPDVNLYVSEISDGVLTVVVQDLPDDCFDQTQKGWVKGRWRRYIPFVDNQPWLYKPAACGDIKDTAKMVWPMETYTISQADITMTQHARYGFAAGALAIPFKMRIRGGEVVAGGSLGPYMGYQVGSAGASNLALIVSAGVSAGQSTAQTASSTAGSSPPSGSGGSATLNPYAAFGAVVKVLGVQTAVLAGQDFGPKSSTTHRWWLSFGVGASFTY